MNKVITKFTAGLLSAGIAVSFIPNITGTENVSAAVVRNKSNLLLGTYGMASPVKPSSPDDAWSGSYVYYGSYEGEPIKFRVLDTDTTKYGYWTMLLDSEEILFENRFDEYSNVWNDSDLRYYLNNAFIDEAFTGKEYKALATSKLTGGKAYPAGSFEADYYSYTGTTGLSGDYVFVLELDEILNEDYGYSSHVGLDLISGTWADPFTYLRKAPNHKKYYGDSVKDWWLRNSMKNKTSAGAVLTYGNLAYDKIGNEEVGVAPAINIKKDSILFSSLISGELGKSGAEYKLTLINNDIKITFAHDENVVCKGRNVTIPYVLSGDYAETVSRVSVLILDKGYMYGNQNNAKILYYEELKGGFEATTTYDYADIVNYGTFTLPSDLDINGWGKDYIVNIIAEDVNGTYTTDYSSLPAAVDKPEIENKGWVEYNGGWYFYNDDGSLAKGWKQINGSWYLFSDSGLMLTGWQNDSGKRYFLTENGAMKTGWMFVEGGYTLEGYRSPAWYYFGSDGAMKTGWQQIGGKWYCFNADGVMKIGFKEIGGKIYFFDSNGAMATGWLYYEDLWFFFENSGSMVTGWKQIGGVYYYFKSNGAMASKEYCDGYWLDENGAWTYKYRATWRKDSTGWWYGDDNGWYAKNQTVKIDGKNYNFNSAGYCTNP